jgi:hypothetical protein
VTRALARGLWVGIAAGAILPMLPLPSAVGGSDRGPMWSPHVSSWVIGIVVVAVFGVIAARLATRLPELPRRSLVLSDRALVGTATIGLFVAILVAQQLLFARNPLLVDEMAQLLHARAVASGRLALPVPEPLSAFLSTHTWVTPAGWVSQYPPGQLILLAAGLLVGAVWLVNPLLGALSTIAVYWTARGLWGRGTAGVASVLWALCSWALFMSATYMNHVAAAALALAAWASVFGPHHPRRHHWLLAGVALAWLAAIRPLDAVGAAVPIGVWMLLRRRLDGIPWLALGGAPVIGAWLVFNWRLFGDPVQLGYTAIYGESHGLGFGVDPWGEPYTPLVGLGNLMVAVRRLHLYLFEWPVPALLPLAIWAALGRQRTASDTAVAAGIIAVPALYFFYWHSGFFPGPSLYYGIAPRLVLGTARAWVWARAGAASRPTRLFRWPVGLGVATAAVLIWGLLGVLPKRWTVYRDGLATLKLHPERQLAERGVGRALVIVRTSWGNRIVADLWAQGVPPGLAEQAYRRLDACALDELRRLARREAWTVEQLTARLDALVATANPPPLVADWPDPTLRLDPSRPIAPACRTELERDLSGFTLYGNLAWRNEIGVGSGIVFARDMIELNGPLLARYAGWQVWHYKPAASDPLGAPVLTPVEAHGDLLQ